MVSRDSCKMGANPREMNIGFNYFGSAGRLAPFACNLLFAIACSAGNVRNGQFNESGYDGGPEAIAKLRAQGWTCPDADKWPKGWSGRGTGATLER